MVIRNILGTNYVVSLYLSDRYSSYNKYHCVARQGVKLPLFLKKTNAINYLSSCNILQASILFEAGSNKRQEDNQLITCLNKTNCNTSCTRVNTGAAGSKWLLFMIKILVGSAWRRRREVVV